MARAATTSDVFNAIAEPRRREIICLLAEHRACSVGELVEAMSVEQPAVSKHLAVLRTVGLVTVSRHGKSRLYSLKPQGLKAIHDWASQFEKLWSRQLSRIKQNAERAAGARAS